MYLFFNLGWVLNNIYAVSAPLAHPLHASETSKQIAPVIYNCYAYSAAVEGSANPLVVDPSMTTPILSLYSYKGINASCKHWIAVLGVSCLKTYSGPLDLSTYLLT